MNSLPQQTNAIDIPDVTMLVGRTQQLLNTLLGTHETTHTPHILTDASRAHTPGSYTIDLDHVEQPLYDVDPDPFVRLCHLTHKTTFFASLSEIPYVEIAKRSYASSKGLAIAGARYTLDTLLVCDARLGALYTSWAETLRTLSERKAPTPTYRSRKGSAPDNVPCATRVVQEPVVAPTRTQSTPPIARLVCHHLYRTLIYGRIDTK